MNHKGVVIEKINENEVLALMPSGEIEKVKTDGQEFNIGDEILFYEKTTTKKVISWNRIFSTISAVAAAFLLFFFDLPFISNLGGSISTGNVYASTLYIEAKSNIKVDIDNDEEVIKVTPLNKPAARVLSDFDWNGMQLDEFLSIYFEKMKEEGYLGAYDKAIISVVSSELERNKTLDEINKALDNDFIKDNGIKVLTLAIPEKVVEKAETLGVTPAKLLIILTAQSVGEKNIPPVDILKTVNVTDLLETSPIVTEILPTYTEEELVKLVEQPSNLNSAPATVENNQQTTTTPNTQPTPNETMETTSTNTQDTFSTSSGNTQPSSETNSNTNSDENHTNSTDSIEQNQTTSNSSSIQDSSNQDSSTPATSDYKQSEQTPEEQTTEEPKPPEQEPEQEPEQTTENHEETPEQPKQSEQAPNDQTSNEQPPTTQPEEKQDQNTADQTKEKEPKEEPNNPAPDQQQQPNTEDKGAEEQQPNKDTEADKKETEKEPSLIDRFVQSVKNLSD